MVLGAATISPAVYAQDKEQAVSTTEEEIRASKETLDKAKTAMENKDYQSAIVYLTVYINAKPKKYEPYKMRGECFYALRQYKLAESDFQTAIDLKTADDKFLTNTKVVGAVILGADKNDQYQNPELGNLYAELMYSQKAQNTQAYEASYQKAFEYNSHIYLPQPKKDEIGKINCPQKYGKVLNPQGADAYIYDVIENIEKGDFHEAAYKLPNITSAFPKYYLGYYLTGVVMAGLEQDKDAISSFETALKYNPYDFESMASLGQIYYSEAEKTFNSADAEKSVEYFNQALKYNPNCYIYYFYIGLNNMLLNKNNLAISNFNSAIKLKSNDYNSIYYKMIAQYLKGDYNAVTEGATKLLYRHVSNYNSVLYLRALAYHKLGNSEAAISDIEKIFAGMNDIYNADVRTLSPKEQTLEAYLYYLKAKILQENGEGAKVDLAKAYKNPIVEALGNPESENVSLTIPSYDLENQYDYIRTAFDNLGVGFVYASPDYKISTTKNKSELLTNIERQKQLASQNESVIVQENKKQEAITELRNNEDIANSFAKESKSAALELAAESFEGVDKSPQLVLKKSTEPEDTLSKENQTSIAQLLASQSLPVKTEASAVKIDDIVKQAKEAPKDDKVIVNMPSAPIMPSKTSVKNDEIIAHDDEVQPTKTPIETKPDNIEQVQNKKEEKIIISAPVQKESEDFTISYDKENIPKIDNKKLEQVEQNMTQEVISQAEEVKEEVQEAVEPVQNNAEQLSEAVQTPKKVVEKYAEFDINDFDIPQKKTALPEIRYDDEIVVFVPKNPITDAGEKLNKEDFSLKNPNTITDNFSQIRQNSETEKTDIAKAANEIVQTQQDIVEVIQEQPEIIVQEVVTDNQTEEKIQKLPKQEEVYQPDIKVDEAKLKENNPIVSIIKEPAAPAKLEVGNEIVSIVKETPKVDFNPPKLEEETSQAALDTSEKLSDNAQQDNQEETLAKFLDKSDNKSIAKAKAKQERKAKKQAKKEEKISAIVQAAINGNLETSELKPVKEKKVKVKTSKQKKESVLSVEQPVSDAIETTADSANSAKKALVDKSKKNKEKIKNNVNNKVEKSEKVVKSKKQKNDKSLEKDVKTLTNKEINAQTTEKKKLFNFKKNKTEKIETPVSKKIEQKEKKTFKWWWKNDNKPAKSNVQKKKFSFKKLITKESGDKSEVFERTENSKKIIKKKNSKERE